MNHLPLLLDDIATQAVPHVRDPWPALRAQLASSPRRGRGRQPRNLRGWPLVAALLALAVVAAGLVTWGPPAASVSAAEILDHAYDVSASAALPGLSSYHVRATRTTRPASGILNDAAIETWGAAPDKRRVSVRCGDCPAEMTADLFEVGNQVWSVTTLNGRQYALRTDATGGPADLLLPLGGTPADVLRRAAQLGCGSAAMHGQASVAQRQAYVIVVDRQPTQTCSSATGNDQFWVDQQTFLLLGAEEHLHSDRVGDEVATYQVDAVDYNVPTSDDLFTYTPTSATRIVASPQDFKDAVASVLATSSR